MEHLHRLEGREGTHRGGPGRGPREEGGGGDPLVGEGVFKMEQTLMEHLSTEFEGVFDMESNPSREGSLRGGRRGGDHQQLQHLQSGRHHEGGGGGAARSPQEMHVAGFEGVHFTSRRRSTSRSNAVPLPGSLSP
eukprot:896049-Prorocentrum_minimum.AAC.2